MNKIYTAYVIEAFDCMLEESNDDFTGSEQYSLISCGVTTNTSKLRDNTITENKSWNVEELGFEPKKGQQVYLIVERFGDGSTFNSRRGLSRPIKIFASNDLARKWLASDEAKKLKDDDFFGGHENYEIHSVIVH